MNVYDAQRMEDVMTKQFEPIQDWRMADVIILNTCHIREGASEKVYSHLGVLNKLKKERHTQGKNLQIGVVGCVAQAHGEQMLARAPFVDFVLGPQAYHTLPDVVQKLEQNPREKQLCLEFDAQEKFNTLPRQVYRRQTVSAFLTIQEGCDKFCTFCVVPYTRGAEVSRCVADIEQEAQSMVHSGVREITLLGQNVNAYHGLDEYNKPTSLATLIKRLAQIENLERIFYTTSHPIDMTDDLIHAHGSEPKLMPYLHLPIQSGNDRILKKMNRHSTRRDYETIVQKLRYARPDIALSSDFIVAFPSETHDEFEDTLSLIRAISFARSFSFKYSPRPGTPAASDPNPIGSDAADARLYQLQEILRDQQTTFNQKSVGQTVPVLVERLDADGRIIGKSPYLQVVYATGNTASPDVVGSLQRVCITQAGLNSLHGEVVYEG